MPGIAIGQRSKKLPNEHSVSSTNTLVYDVCFVLDVDKPTFVKTYPLTCELVGVLFVSSNNTIQVLYSPVGSLANLLFFSQNLFLRYGSRSKVEVSICVTVVILSFFLHNFVFLVSFLPE